MYESSFFQTFWEWSVARSQRATEKRVNSLPHPLAVFPADISLHRPNNLNAWDRIVGVKQRIFFVAQAIKFYLKAQVRLFTILTWLQGFSVKIATFSRLHCLTIPRRDLSTKKTKPDIEKWPESLEVMLNLLSNLLRRGTWPVFRNWRVTYPV